MLSTDVFDWIRSRPEKSGILYFGYPYTQDIRHGLEMGINTSFARLLARAKTQGTVFSDTLTIGRQSLTIPSQEVPGLASQLGLTAFANIAEDSFAEGFLKSFLCASSVRSMDYSAYQDADIVHDLNQPIPDELRGAFDTLIDGGSIEHIFDIKQVLSNYMGLVKRNGNIFLMTTANNLCGHGFYQFSPEFFYRVFDPSNGFETLEVALIESPLLSVERSRHTLCFHANDPSVVGKRIQLVNCRPTMIFVHAQKTSDIEPFSNPPLQSDYSEVKWETKRIESGPEAARQSSDKAEFSYLSIWEELRRRVRQRRKNSHRNKRFFKRIGF